MIVTVADLLKEFISAEVEFLNKQDIKHPTTIGTMYEGLTETILNKSVFGELNLKIVKNSLIRGCANEFDVMLIEGEAEKIPYADRYICEPEQIIAIIQVRKNLYSKDLKETYESLNFIVEYFKGKTPNLNTQRMLRDGFRAICRKDLSSKKSGNLTKNEEYILNSLQVDAVLPKRIVIGYNSFKSEFNLRESFVNYLSDNITTSSTNLIKGYGPHNFPNLIICENHSIIKGNGMPLGLPIQEENWWCGCLSSSYNPAYFFLEMIWTHLVYKYDHLSTSIFGEDLMMEPVNRFVDFRIKELSSIYGWELHYFEMSKESLKSHTEVEEWGPTEIDIAQYAVISQLGEQGEIEIATDPGLEKYVMENGYPSLADFLKKFTDTGLVYLENGKLKFLTDECNTVFMPDGRILAGENKSGRLSNWVLKHTPKKVD